MTAPLSADQVAQWHDQGFTAVPGFFAAAQVRALQAEVARLQGAGKLRNVATDGDGKTTSTSKANLQICPVGPHSRLLRALPHDAHVQAALAQLFGPCRLLHWLDQIFLKPAGHGAGTGWHTDNAYWKIRDPVAGTGMWIAVHDATRANGTMRVIPYSHRRALDHVRDGDSDHHITCKHVVDERVAVPIELPAGGVLFFNFGIAHATGPNPTTRDRAGLAYHFLRADHADVAKVPATPPYYTERMALGDGGHAAWGEDLHGVFAGSAA